MGRDSNPRYAFDVNTLSRRARRYRNNDTISGFQRADVAIRRGLSAWLSCDSDSNGHHNGHQIPALGRARFIATALANLRSCAGPEPISLHSARRAPPADRADESSTACWCGINTISVPSDPYELLRVIEPHHANKTLRVMCSNTWSIIGISSGFQSPPRPPALANVRSA